MSDFKPNPPIPNLLPGDLLMYSPSSPTGWIISIKTWTLLSHVESYIGGGKCIGARMEGVRIYSERIDKYLRYIRRPIMPAGKVFDAVAAHATVAECLDKPYCVHGLFAFFNPWNHTKHVNRICSVVCTLYLKGGGCNPFNPDLEADDVSPAQLFQTNDLETIWERVKQ